MNFIRNDPPFKVRYYEQHWHHLYELGKILVHPDLQVWYFVGREPNTIERKLLRIVQPRVYVVRSDYMEEFSVDLDRCFGDAILLWSDEREDTWKKIWKDYWIPPYHGVVVPTEPAEGGGVGPQPSDG